MVCEGTQHHKNIVSSSLNFLTRKVLSHGHAEQSTANKPTCSPTPIPHAGPRGTPADTKVAGNYQHQWARRMLCDSTSTTAGGMNKDQLKLRLSGLLGVELSDGEVDVLFRKYADP